MLPSNAVLIPLPTRPAHALAKPRGLGAPSHCLPFPRRLPTSFHSHTQSRAYAQHPTTLRRQPLHWRALLLTRTGTKHVGEAGRTARKMGAAAEARDTHLPPLLH
jgi:hypothetical protein